MHSFKKNIAVLLSIVMVISMLTACKKHEVEEKKVGKEGNEAIAFTMFNADTTAGQQYDNYESPVAQKIKELIGVTLDIEYAIGDPKQKFALMTASGDYPDFIYAVEFSNVVVDAGGFIKLDDLIEKYGSNIKKVYGEHLKKFRWSIEEPNIYI